MSRPSPSTLATRSPAVAPKMATVRYARRKSDTSAEPSDRFHRGPKSGSQGPKPFGLWAVAGQMPPQAPTTRGAGRSLGGRGEHDGDGAVGDVDHPAGE